MYLLHCMLTILILVNLLLEVKTFRLNCKSRLLTNYGRNGLSRGNTSLNVKNKYNRSDFEGKDIFDEDDDIPDDPAFSSAKRKGKKASADVNVTAEKKKVKLEPETVFFEGPPSATEVIFPAISILTVIGIVPFVSAVTRQFWVKYKFTSRRVSIRSGFQGQTQTDVIYSDIDQIKFVYRLFGAAGDMVLYLKDGAKVELRHVPKFEEIYNYVISKCDDECQLKSMKLKVTGNNDTAKSSEAPVTKAFPANK